MNFTLKFTHLGSIFQDKGNPHLKPTTLECHNSKNTMEEISELDWSAMFSHHLGAHILQNRLCRAQLCGDRKSRTSGHLFHQWDHRLSQEGPALSEQPRNWVHPLWKVGRKTVFLNSPLNYQHVYPIA